MSYDFLYSILLVILNLYCHPRILKFLKMLFHESVPIPVYVSAPIPVQPMLKGEVVVHEERGGLCWSLRELVGDHEGGDTYP